MSQCEYNHQPSFKKMIAQDPTDLESRSIPANFKEIIGGTFPCTIVLKTPLAGESTIHVCEESSGKLTMLDGWKDFVLQNLIKPYDLLVFEYMGNVTFNVLHFDPSGLEKLATSQEIKDNEAFVLHFDLSAGFAKLSISQEIKDNEASKGTSKQREGKRKVSG